MTKFVPSIYERETDELIEIANCKDENIWQKEATIQAKKELIKRNISQKQQNIVILDKENKNNKTKKAELKRLESNRTKSYNLLEIILLFLFGPLIFFSPFLFGSDTMFELVRENYILKFKQRIIVFVLSFISWGIYGNYTFNQSEKKRLEEIEKIDISDWKKKHGYE